MSFSVAETVSGSSGGHPGFDRIVSLRRCRHGSSRQRRGRTRALERYPGRPVFESAAVPIVTTVGRRTGARQRRPIGRGIRPLARIISKSSTHTYALKMPKGSGPRPAEAKSGAGNASRRVDRSTRARAEIRVRPAGKSGGRDDEPRRFSGHRRARSRPEPTTGKDPSADLSADADALQFDARPSSRSGPRRTRKQDGRDAIPGSRLRPRCAGEALMPRQNMLGENLSAAGDALRRVFRPIGFRSRGVF